MGYLSTLTMIIFGVSIMFYFYGDFINDPITRSYGLDAEHAANLSAQMGDPLSSMNTGGLASRDITTSDFLYNLIMGSLAGAGLAAAASLLYGSSFSSMYILPAVAIGGILGLIMTPLDMISKLISTGNTPESIGIIFIGFMMTGVFLMILNLIFGGDRV